MGRQKERAAIDTIATLIYIMQEQWEEKKLSTALFMDVKAVFNHVSERPLIIRMIELVININFMT